MKARGCSVEHCDRDHLAKGYCSGHYQQVKSGGPIGPISPIVRSLPPTERFLAKVQRSSGCWEWAAGKTQDGYGAFYLNGRSITAHRASWILFRGSIPDAHDVDHKCHNRRCVNPDHLQVATHKQNMENQDGAHANSRSGIRGVFPRWNKWIAVVGAGGKKHHVGVFATLEEAEAAVIAKRNELFTNNLIDRKAS